MEKRYQCIPKTDKREERCKNCYFFGQTTKTKEPCPHGFPMEYEERYFNS